VAILRACAKELHEKTNGVLVSQVSTANIDHQGPATLHSFIKKGLGSDQVRSTLASLIAMATQVLEDAEVDPNDRPSDNGGVAESGS
jgi:hypothetical protein